MLEKYKVMLKYRYKKTRKEEEAAKRMPNIRLTKESDMDNSAIVERYTEEKKEITSKLRALHNTILSLYAELESEQVEQQALDAIECIGFCVNDIINALEKKVEKDL